MTRQIIALFASSFLSVSMTIPVTAEEKAGIIAAVDREQALLTLADGSVYGLPVSFDFEALRPGMVVHVIVGDDA